MFEECIKQSKPLPNFAGTDAHQVFLMLHGEIQDPAFLRFLEKIGEERMRSFVTEDFLAIDLIHRDQPVPPELQSRLHQLIEQGVVESFGRGRGAQYLLSRQYFSMVGKKGVYTRRRGLDRETNKTLLLKHIRENQEAGSPLAELRQVLPSLTRRQVQRPLECLRDEGKAHSMGTTSSSRWYPDRTDV